MYILSCSDTSLYTGISVDVVRRVYEHNATKGGAKYTRSRRPVALIYQEGPMNKQEALRREREIKSMSRIQKQKLISGRSDIAA